jgi:hypothetical protein
MMLSSSDFKQKIHSIISATITIPISFIYGFYPNAIFNISPKTLDEQNFLKAIMGLYLGFSALWVIGVLKTNYLNVALFSNVIFMLGLGFGRVCSYFIDGTASFIFIVGMFGELCLGFYGLWVLTYKNSNFAKN